MTVDVKSGTVAVMNDYEILLALNGLEIARHVSVVKALEDSVGVKGALLDEVNAEIAERRHLICVLEARRGTFNVGALRRRRGVKGRQLAVVRWCD